ncbi:non-specific lipid-transfer protein 1-like [Asparagus officinalis]|uniref:non-specific lipid-transfer protein 1-like n=1 Tax=Asparagus officinalis TaxID=4686 RepID=UPI00098E7FFA|nr:non-specific lipid-transfer protein 1-like [Asparagus officinalis]
MARSSTSPLFAFLLALALVSTPYGAEGVITLPEVMTLLYRCLGYYSGSGNLTEECCNGIRGFTSFLKNPAEREEGSNFYAKHIAPLIDTVDESLITKVSETCGVNLPFPRGSPINCSMHSLQSYADELWTDPCMELWRPG